MTKISLKRKLEHQQTLTEAALTFSSTLDPNLLLSRIVEYAVSVLEADEALILLPDERWENLLLRAYKGEDINVLRRVPIRIDDSLLGGLLMDGKTRVLKNQPVPELFLDTALPSFICLPLNLRQKPIGLLCVYNRTQGKYFSKYGRELLSQLAALGSVAIANADLLHDSQARSFDMALIIDSSEAVNSTLSLAQVLSLIGKSLLKALQSHWCEVMIIDHESQNLMTWSVQRLAYWRSNEALKLAASLGPELDRVINDKKWVRLETDESRRSLTAFDGGNDSLLVPITLDGEFVGMLHLAFLYRMPASIDREELQHLADSIANSVLQDQAMRAVHFARQILRNTKAGWCNFWTWDEDNRHFKRVVSVGDAVWLRPPYPTRPLKSFPTFTRAISQQTILAYAITDANLPLDIRTIMERMQARLVMVVPLYAQEQNLGVVVIAHTLREEQFDSREINLGHALVLQAANAIKNAQLFEDLQHSLYELHRTQAKLVQTARLGAIGQLSAAVAHQINNPLTTILGDAELILSDMPDSDINHEGMEAIYRAGQRAQEVVRRLLSIARQKSPDEHPEKLDINGTIRNALTLVESALYRGRVRLDVNLLENLPLAYGIPGQLEDVWLNLILNARDAIGKEKSPMIGISSNYRVESNMVEVIVWDNGPGFTSDNSGQVYDAFFTTKPPGEGTGLGLYICKHIVEQCGGSISINSEYKDGAMFTVVLPCKVEVTT